MRIRWSGGELGPGEVLWVKEERRGEGRVLREDAEEVGGTVSAAKGE